MLVILYIFFFFKQQTAYEMRISDWSQTCALPICIKVIFFDGRGGPPARGGGKTHRFYSSLGTEIETAEIQLTVQGQTISSNFGTIESARFNSSEERREGKECVSKCRSRWSPYH